MYIKLNFTTNKNLFHVFRMLTDIINTPTVANVATFYARANSASYTPNMISGFDPATSQIIRTTEPATGVKAHFAGQPSTTSSKFTLEFGTYDDSSVKYYIQYVNSSTTYTSYYLSMGTAITGGTMASSQLGLSVADANTVYSGTQLTTAGYSTDYTTVGTYIAGTSAASSAATTSIRTLWAYVSNTTIIWATNQTATLTGWPAFGNNVTSQSGPHIYGQYTRWDYWNNNVNGIVPVIFTYPRSDGYGLTANDFVYATNDQYFSTATLNLGQPGQISPFFVLNTAQLGLGLNSSRSYVRPSIITSTPVNHILQTRGSDQTGTQGGFANTEGNNFANNNTVAVAVGQVISTVYGTRAATADLTSGAFLHMPLSWHKHSVGAFGGNVTEKSGFYIFNGEFFPGDEYVLDGVTYAVWPLYDGTLRRIGISVPKV